MMFIYHGLNLPWYGFVLATSFFFEDAGVEGDARAGIPHGVSLIWWTVVGFLGWY